MKLFVRQVKLRLWDAQISIVGNEAKAGKAKAFDIILRRLYKEGRSSVSRQI